ncbi:MAG: hypothetical protein Kow00120_12070 [Anaerolineae bacterium]
MKPISYYDLIEMFPKPGCVVCNLLLRDARRLLDATLYELVNDADTQRAFRGRRGLCNTHSWQLKHFMGYSLGIATLYRTSITEVLNIIEQSPVDAGNTSNLARFLGSDAESGLRSLADALEPTEPCMVCAMLAKAEADYVWTLCQHLTDARIEAAYRESSGLCLPHFQQFLRAVSDPARARHCIAIQRAIWSRLRADLEEFIAKNDYRRHDEPMGPEGDSWSRAIASLAGGKGVFGVDPRSA